MQGTMLEHNVIQIAGVMDEVEASMLQQCGIKYLGFPLRLPVHKEDLTEKEAAKVIKGLDPSVFGVLITYLESAAEIVDLCQTVGVRIVQLHGNIHVDDLKHLKVLRPDLTVIKSLVIGLHGNEALESTMHDLSEFVDAFITDTYNPETGASGATGKTHDWSVSHRLVELSDRPVILAGGLTPENVRRAILEVKPTGVDSHTGVEDATGRKSRVKVQAFVGEAQAAFSMLKGTTGGP